MNQDQVATAHGILGLSVLALIVLALFHVFGFRVVVTTALRGGRA